MFGKGVTDVIELSHCPDEFLLIETLQIDGTFVANTVIFASSVTARKVLKELF